MSPVREATRTLELELLAGARYVIGLDEVGRGALAGPVSVGAAIVDADCAGPPPGLTDSKLLTALRRERLIEPIGAWVRAGAVGHAQASEIDAIGLTAALRLAGVRALAVAAERCGGIAAVAAQAAIILDGTHNWLVPVLDLFDAEPHPWCAAPVTMKVKADRDCAVVAAASVLAKVERDEIMRELPDPGYGFAEHKGYAAASHREAIVRLGASAQHRRTWRLTAGGA